MSFFTLRKKGKKIPISEEKETLQIPGSRGHAKGQLHLSNSTPNLHKINNSELQVASHPPHPHPQGHQPTPKFFKKKLSHQSQAPSLKNLFSHFSIGSSTPGPTKRAIYAYNNNQHSAFDLRGNAPEGEEGKDETDRHSYVRSESTFTVRGNFDPGLTSSSQSNSSNSSCSDLQSSKEASIPPNGSLASFEEIREKVDRSPEEMERISEMLKGIKKFNMNPKEGVEYLVNRDIIRKTPEDVAHFLLQAEGLSKTAIGNYLGERIGFNEEVLHAFVRLHDFSGIHLVQALRQFLWSFRLPGEAQKIDRMMESFATHYCSLNHGLFTSTDTCYLLSYSIIMLNTLLHNASVKDKPSEDKFIRMNRDIDSGRSLDPSFLSSLYQSILTEPFKIPQDENNDLNLTFFNPDIEGWLWKLGHTYKIWKRRFFMLNNHCLYVFKFTTDKTPREIIPLENLRVRLVPDKVSSKHNSFILFKEPNPSNVSEVVKSCKTLSDGQIIPGKHTVFHLAAFNPRDRDKWVRAIEDNVSKSDFYSVLAEKKRKILLSRSLSTVSKAPSLTQSVASLTMLGTGTLGRRNKQKSIEKGGPSPSPNRHPPRSQTPERKVTKSPKSPRNVRKSQIGIPAPNPELPHKNPHDYFTKLEHTPREEEDQIVQEDEDSIYIKVPNLKRRPNIPNFPKPPRNIARNESMPKEETGGVKSHTESDKNTISISLY